MKPAGYVNLLLVLALAGACVLIGIFRFNPERRNPYWINDMVDSPAYGDQSANPVLPHGQTLQPPPEGSVARGIEPLPYRAGSDEDMEFAGDELHTPLAARSPAVLARGREMFDRMCAVCHGPRGAGDGPIVAHGFPQPPNLLASHARGLPDGSVFYKITYGGAIMPAYAAQVPRKDRWTAIAWLRELQRTNKAPVEKLPPGASGPGWGLIGKSDCLACHTLDHKLVGPAYQDVAKRYARDPKAVAILVQKVKAGGSGVWGTVKMTPHPALAEDQITEMVKAILGLRPGAAALAPASAAPATAPVSPPAPGKP